MLLPGFTSQGRLSEQQVPARPQQDKLWAEGKGHSLPVHFPGSRMREGPISSPIFTFRHRHMSVMLFMKKRQDKATTVSLGRDTATLSFEKISFHLKPAIRAWQLNTAVVRAGPHQAFIPTLEG